MTHIIKTQKLQLEIPKTDNSWGVQNSFKQAFYEQVVHRLEKVCDEFDGDLEIDRLEIDAGEIGLSDIDGLWVNKIENSFREQIQQLAKARVNAGKAVSKNTTKASHTKLEMIVHFLKSGVLPWWSEKFRPVILSKILTELLTEKPQEVARALTKTFPDKRTVKRFVSQFEYTLQEKVIQLLIDNSPVSTLKLKTIEVIKRVVDEHQRNDKVKITNNLLVTSFLETIIEGQKKSLSVNEQFKNLLLKLTAGSTLENTALFYQSIKTSAKGSKSATKQYHPLTDQAVLEVATKLIESLSIDPQRIEKQDRKVNESEKVDSLKGNHQIEDSSSQQQDTKEARSSNKSEKQKSDSDRSGDGLSTKEGVENRDKNKLDKNTENQEVERQSKEQVKKSEEKADISKDAEYDKKNQPNESAYRRQKEREKEDKEQRENKRTESQLKNHTGKEQDYNIHTSDKKDLKEGGLNSENDKQNKSEVPAEEMTQEDKLQQTAEILKSLEKGHTQSSNEESPKSSQEAELPKEIYIENAGLVLLWPYLPRFFDNMGLVQKGAFKSEADRKTAVILTQYLIEAEPELHEYQLLLNKILCAFPLNETIEKEAISEEEQEECESLLESVIQNWSVIKNTSVPGFRQTFLQRKGKLTNQGNSWLLQVEKETFDMLLEQLPWQISVVKLHWMDKPVYVEW